MPLVARRFCLRKPGSSLPQQRSQGQAEEFAERNGNGLPITHFVSFEPAKTLHQIEGRAVDLNRLNRRPAMEPLAPTSGITGTPLPKGGRSLNHGGRRQCRSSGNDSISSVQELRTHPVNG